MIDKPYSIIYPSELKRTKSLIKSMLLNKELSDEPWIYKYQGPTLPEGHHYIALFQTMPDIERFRIKRMQPDPEIPSPTEHQKKMAQLTESKPTKDKYKVGDRVMVTWGICEHRPMPAEVIALSEDEIYRYVVKFNNNDTKSCHEGMLRRNPD